MSVFNLVRCAHILTGTLWAGGAILIAVYILPAATAAGPGGAAVLRQLTAVRKLPQTLLGLAAVTVLSGVSLVWLASAGLHGAWFTSRVGIAYSVGGAAGFGAFLIGALVNIPTAGRIGALTRETQGPSDGVTPVHNQTLRRLAARLLWGTRAVAILVGLTTIAMGLARYLV